MYAASMVMCYRTPTLQQDTGHVWSFVGSDLQPAELQLQLHAWHVLRLMSQLKEVMSVLFHATLTCLAMELGFAHLLKVLVQVYC